MRTSIALLAASLALTGCAVEHSDASDEGSSESTQDALATSTLYGTWQRSDGSGAFNSLTFEKTGSSTLGGLKGRAFSANIDTGVRCIKAPCPQASTDVAGVYKLSRGVKLTLASYDKPTAVFGKVLGEYTVTASKGTLLLKKSDGTVVETFKPATPAGVVCGSNTCGSGEYCCDPLHSHCIKMGFMCAL